MEPEKFSFSEIQEAGAHKFGLAWLNANEAVVNMMSMKLRVNYTDSKTKRIMAGAIFATLLSEEHRNKKLDKS